MEWNFETLGELPGLIWQALERGARHFDDPLRMATLATSDDLGAHVRIVILRGVDAAHRQLVCHTDARSAKIRQLRKNPQAHWLFYDPAQRVQIHASGHAMIHHDDAIDREAWLATPLGNRINYCTTLAPGNRLATPEAAWPAGWREQSPTVEEAAVGQANFAMIVTTIEQLEWLQLRPEGNRRAGFTWDRGEFKGHWLVP